MGQGVFRHSNEIAWARALHQESIDQAIRHHHDALEQEAHHHKRNVSLKWELYAKKMSFSADVARREAVRDIWQQRNEVVQTMLVISVLMFGCAYSLHCSGTLPKSTYGTTVAYSFFVSMSLLILLSCIASLVMLHNRVAKYDIHHPFRRYKGCNRLHKDFNEYYGCHCRLLSRVSMALFYGGSGVLYVAAGIRLLSAFLVWFHDPASCALFSIPLVFGLGFVAVISWKFPDRTRIGREDYGGLSGLTAEKLPFSRSMSASSAAEPTTDTVEVDPRVEGEEMSPIVTSGVESQLHRPPPPGRHSVVADSAVAADNNLPDEEEYAEADMAAVGTLTPEAEDTALIQIDSGHGSVPVPR